MLEQARAPPSAGGGRGGGAGGGGLGVGKVLCKFFAKLKLTLTDPWTDRIPHSYVPPQTPFHVTFGSVSSMLSRIRQALESSWSDVSCDMAASAGTNDATPAASR